MLGAVGVDAEIGGLERRKSTLPHSLAAARAGSGSPEVSDRIADEQHVNVALLRDFEEGIMTGIGAALEDGHCCRWRWSASAPAARRTRRGRRRRGRRLGQQIRS